MASEQAGKHISGVKEWKPGYQVAVGIEIRLKGILRYLGAFLFGEVTLPELSPKTSAFGSGGFAARREAIISVCRKLSQKIVLRLVAVLNIAFSALNTFRQ